MFRNFILIFSFFLVVNYSNAISGHNLKSATISLKTSLGTVVGHKQQVQNKTINVFYGVPYAKPPVGKLRFRRTKLIDRFQEEPYRALEYKPHCEQSRAKKYGPNDKFSEDCLYMNIYTPDLVSKNGICRKKYATMVYIYGGISSIYQRVQMVNKTEDAPLSYSGELFAALQDTIFVSFNYRQELFSSLLVEGEFGGNLGLFDQNLAFKWVKRHIKDYCGDDRQITVFGNSLGSNAIGLHLISDYSKGLISNAIMQSFAPLFRSYLPVSKTELLVNSFLAINELKCLKLDDSKTADYLKSLDESVRRKFSKFIDEKEFLKKKSFLMDLHRDWRKFASKLKDGLGNLGDDDYVDKDVLKLIKFLSETAVDIECLQKLPPEKILNVGRTYTEIIWSYCFDFDFISTDAYLNYKLLDKLSVDPKVNILIGSVSDEVCTTRLTFKDLYTTDKFNAPAIPKNDAKKVIRSFSYLVTDKTRFADVLADYYTDEKRWRLEDGYSQSISNFNSDYEYYCPLQFYAESAAQSNANSVSAYIMTQVPTRHFGSFLFDYDLDTYAWLGGPCHADELNSLFGMPFRIPSQYSDVDREFSRKLIGLWTFFAKNGRMPHLNPSQERWPISTQRSAKPRYVEINNRYTRENTFEFEERCEEFWRPLLPLYQK